LVKNCGKWVGKLKMLVANENLEMSREKKMGGKFPAHIHPNFLP
jgi:hypothetical protein